ncbi:AbiU2 domain-containing protein [Marinobacterium rhizophilum]|uniref:HEPN AbiU2-like domain-containing protein n=1 Tax=Marinobacterium rhizophilum TaxID=420402 RepID=A0ABY5HPD0_9GAMM|nr:hypothetical protein [Marinobacterium rhizophilum]UTW13084.1 hypothetical protein KDW95_05330 [Marinobacterium rhizophilum]
MTKSKKPKLETREIYKALSLVIAETMSAEQIWRYLISPQTHQDYETQLGIYIPFFNGVRQSTFVTTVLGLAKFSDSQNNALNAKTLLDALGANDAADTKEIERLNERYSDCAETWKKIMKIRHNVFAHTSASVKEDEAFAMVSITPNEISAAVEIAREILVGAGNFLDGPAPELTFDQKSTERDISKLFKNLKAGREARLNANA